MSQLDTNTCSAPCKVRSGASLNNIANLFPFPVVKPSNLQSLCMTGQGASGPPTSCIFMTQSCRSRFLLLFFFSLYSRVCFHSCHYKHLARKTHNSYLIYRCAASHFYCSIKHPLHQNLLFHLERRSLLMAAQITFV